MRRASFVARTALTVGVAGLAAIASFGPSCTIVEESPIGTGGTGGVDAGGNVLNPGELCTQPPGDLMKVRVLPGAVFLPPCAGAKEGCTTRDLKVIVDPDICEPGTLTFESSNPDVVAAPADDVIDLHRSEVPITLTAGPKSGSATITVHAKVNVVGGTTAEVTTTIAVEVIDPVKPACSGTASTPALKAGDTLTGTTGLAGASIGLPVGADKPNGGSFLWSVSPFPTDLACGADLSIPGYVSLGPAIAFGPADKTFKRELPLSIPLNPAMLPSAARLRHLRVAYSGPSFKTPRTVAVSDPRVEKIGGAWALTFKAPRLGTYQAVVKANAGTKTQKRRLTHRAAIGVSMGGGGTATFGARHHDLFDVLAPLGGPVDWTWLLDYIEKNHLGGFRPIAPGTTLAQIQLASTPCTTGAECLPDETCVGVLAEPPTPGRCLLMPVAKDPYEHPQTFNTWWYEYPKTGNGGSFSRTDYAQIFRDLALMYGNPNGDNFSPGAENLPAGVPPDHPSVQGDHLNGECQVWVDPLDGPDKDKQQQIANTCPGERCAHTLTLANYYDDEYNPDGTFPVITVCDGNQQNDKLTPYANTWHSDGNNYPLEVGLAVDYNGNGVRDELEPIVRAGHEPWLDYGVDGKRSQDEPGYVAGVNDDPAGDDYHPQYNPTGTEGDHRWQPGEHYDDYGLDGVMGTKQQPAAGYKQPGDGYDVGEGDGKFTVSRGLQRFWDRDAHSIVRRTVDPAKVPGGELTDQALSRLDVWTDGGTRDLFNFAVDAQHLAGAFAARDRDVAYLTDFTYAPGLDPTKPTFYDPRNVVYDDMQGVVFQRYGKVDPSDQDVEKGSGQHVGTGNEIAARLQSALYFIGSRWREPELRMLNQESSTKPYKGAPVCEIVGNCTLDFTSKDGRKGPVGITLPPGYANEDLAWVRYPVIYMLHGYGQGPTDLEAAIAFLRNWMNSPLDSAGSRLPKAILVYVDGRCRIGASGKAECIRGTFYADSVRKDGSQDEQWWLELMDYIDQNYRTMGETNVDWSE